MTRLTFPQTALICGFSAATFLGGVAGACWHGAALESPLHAEEINDKAAAAQHGEYLVHHVAMCIYCHTPKDEDGSLKRQQLLAGAPIPVQSPYSQQWATNAPNLAGLPAGFSEKDFVRFLMTGKTPTERYARPPMPPFRMNEADARAIAAYLKSVR
jgi:mono/diheme cytochrome c family protein